MIHKIEYRFIFNLGSALSNDDTGTSSRTAGNSITDEITRKMSASKKYRWKSAELEKITAFFRALSVSCDVSWNDFNSAIMSIKCRDMLFKGFVSHYNADIVFTVTSPDQGSGRIEELAGILDSAAASSGLYVYKYIYDGESLKAYSLSGGKFTTPLSGFIGVDVGSISTNVVFVDGNSNVIELVYTYTRGRVLDALKSAFTEMEEKLPDNAIVLGVGVTGRSGELAKSILRADIYRTEIYSHAAATIHQLPEVKSILEIGGQDSKVIYVNNGIPEKSKMNEWGGAGTGAMLDA
jgi:hypothetical protein